MYALAALLAASAVVSAAPAADSTSKTTAWVKDFQNFVTFGDR